jgi:hypothetical protein
MARPAEPLVEMFLAEPRAGLQAAEDDILLDLSGDDLFEVRRSIGHDRLHKV